MGIYNRDYLRDEEGFDAYSDSGKRSGPMSIVNKLIIVTVGMFVLQLLTSRQGGSSLILDWLSLDSVTLFSSGQIWRLLSYAFCHSTRDLWHLVFNMYFLYMIGRSVCQLTGDREFVWFYLVSAIFAGICSVVFYRLMDLPAHIIGASGAVMAVFVLLVQYYPRRKVYFFGIFPIEMRWLLALFVAMDAFPVLMMVLGDPQRIAAEAAVEGRQMTANSAHLGGLLFGFLYYRWNMRLSAWWDRFSGRLPTLKRKPKHLRVFNPVTQPEPEIALSAKIDEILEKISREGESSLTAKERNLLTQASRQLRKGKQ